MSQKFIQVDGTRVTLIHNMPFDPVNGLHKTEAALLQMGVLLDQVPPPENQPGKIALPYYTPEQGFYYAYTDKPADRVDAVEAKLDYMMMMGGMV